MEQEAFYEQEYDEPTVTNLPTAEQVEERAFDEYLKDRIPYLSGILDALSPSSVLDYGCSWGYVVDWMSRNGIEDPVGFEISESNAHFGRSHLGVSIYSDLETLEAEREGDFDVIYTAHVLEHLEEYDRVFQAFRTLLAPGGSLVIVVPNASDEALDARGRSGWRILVGEAHTVAFTYSFLEYMLDRENFSIKRMGHREQPEIRLVARLRG